MTLRRTLTISGLLAALAATAVAAATPRTARDSSTPHPTTPRARIAKVGAPAPDFSVVDTRGRRQSLSAYRGKWVVLEWFSYDCPFTMKHYDTGNMQALQRTYTAKGVVWLSIVSSAPGKPGYMTAAALNRAAAQKHAAATAIIRDTTGDLGHLYGARNTPQMFVIDPSGVLRYAGAMDDRPTARKEDVATAHNYVRAALDAALAGKPIAVPETQPYGCIVQYDR